MRGAGSREAPGVKGPESWVGWALASAFFAGATAVLAKIGVTGTPSNLATAIRTGVVLVFAWGVVLATGEGREIPGLGARTWAFLALSGLATGLSWLCYFRALALGRASQVAPVDKLSVVFALVLAAAFLGEKMGGRQWTGAGLIVAGAILLALK